MSFRVLLVDRQLVIHQGFEQILSGTEFEVVSAETRGDRSIKHFESGGVDLLVTDFQLADGTCFRLLQAAKDARIPVLMFTSYDNPMFISRAIELGAYGLIYKNAPPQELIDALRKISQGKRTWHRRDLRRVTGALATDRLESDIDLPLTNREYEILLGVTRGMTNKRIADELTISYETVKEHVQHILRKLGVTDRTQAAVWAVRKGIV